IMVDKGLLHRMKLAILLNETFDRGDGTALDRCRQREARQDAPSINQHGASAALTVITALLCAGEIKVLAQRIEQRSAHINCESMLALIDIERDGDRIARVEVARSCRCRIGGQRASDERSCGRRCCSHQKISPALIGTFIGIGHWNSPGPSSLSREE